MGHDGDHRGPQIAEGNRSALVGAEQVIGTRAQEERSPLFREEALAAAADLRFGRPVSLMPPSWSWISLFLVIVVASTIAFLFTASYSRKETARGVLRLESGDARVFGRDGGVVRTVLVADGDMVEQGAPVAIVSTSRALPSGALADEALLRGVSEQEENFRARLAALEASAPYDEQALDARIASLRAEREAAVETAEATEQRLRIAQERLEAVRPVYERGFMSRDEMGRREEMAIMLRQAGAEARARVQSLAAQISELHARKEQQPYTTEQERAAIASQLAETTQQRAMYQSAEGYALRAPVAGRVTALQASPGLNVDAQRPLMEIVPPDSPLIAEVYVPSRAIGFVRIGQSVRLLYDAFPYQRFGSGSGRVVAVSASVLRPSEVGAAVPVEEPVYRVVVRLDRASIPAFGHEMPLQSGMAVTADIILEKRSFAAWLFEPVLAMRGRL